MTDPALPAKPGRLARSILHPTVFTSQSDLALAHALRLALTDHANLHILHAGQDTEQEWDEFPSVRQVLQRWGMIADGASRSDVADLTLLHIGSDAKFPKVEVPDGPWHVNASCGKDTRQPKSSLPPRIARQV